MSANIELHKRRFDVPLCGCCYIRPFRYQCHKKQDQRPYVITETHKPLYDPYILFVGQTDNVNENNLQICLTFYESTYGDYCKNTIGRESPAANGPLMYGKRVGRYASIGRLAFGLEISFVCFVITGPHIVFRDYVHVDRNVQVYIIEKQYNRDIKIMIAIPDLVLCSY